MWLYVLTVNAIFISVNFSLSHTIEFLELIHVIIRSYSTTDSLMMLCFSLVRLKLVYASATWNAHDYRLHYISEHITKLQPFVTAFFPSMYYLYENLLEKLNLRTRNTRRRQVDVLLLVNIFEMALNFSPRLQKPSVFMFLLATFNYFMFSSSPSHCPLVRYASAAFAVCSWRVIFRNLCLNLCNIN